MANKFEDYNASQIVPQFTLLQKFNKLIDYMKANPSVNIFRIEDDYEDGTLTYALSDISTHNATVESGDLLFFSNAYVGEVESVGDTLVTISSAVLLPKGAKGDKGDKGDPGETGGVSAWENLMKQYVVQNENTNTTEVGNKLEVDGDVTLNSQLEVKDHTTLEDLRVDGDTQLAGTETEVNGTLTVEGATSMYSNLDVAGHLEVQGACAIHGDVNFGETSGTSQKTDIHGTLQVHNTIIVDNEEKIVDPNGYSLLPYAGYRGIDLTTRFADEISQFSDAWAWIKNRIDNANFVGLNIKDYIPLTLNGNVYKMQIAGIDTYYKNGNPEIGHHIDFISHELWATTVQWNLVNNNNGTSVNAMPFMASNVKAYLMAETMNVPNSDSNNTTLTSVDYTGNGILAYFPNSLKSLIVEKNVLKVNRYNDDGTLRTSENIDWSWQNLPKLWLPDEIEVYGRTVYETNGDAYGNFFRQYPLFEDGEERVKGVVGGGELARTYWWLLAPASGYTTYATSVSDTGSAGYITTAYSPSVPVCFRIA